MTPSDASGPGAAMPGRLPLALVVAVSENGVIGRDQALPWRLPSDLKRFRALTWGKPLLMGRKTFESIGKPLPGRISIVVSADPAFTPPDGVRRASSFGEARSMAEAAARELGADEIAVIGGRQVFADALGEAQTLHLTLVHAAPAGDVRFPAYDGAQWEEVAREGPLQNAGDEAAFTYITLARRA